MPNILDLRVFYNFTRNSAEPIPNTINSYIDSTRAIFTRLEETIATNNMLETLKCIQDLLCESSALGGTKISEYLDNIEALLISTTSETNTINLEEIRLLVDEFTNTCTRAYESPIKCILLIDDSRMPLILGSKILEQNHIKAITASSGTEGVELFKANISEIDLVITDLFMPDFDGDEVYKQIKEHSPETIVILATGYDDLENSTSSRIDFADGCIKKPLSYAKLLEAISPLI